MHCIIAWTSEFPIGHPLEDCSTVQWCEENRTSGTESFDSETYWLAYWWCRKVKIGCSDEEKDHFWSDLEEEMEKVPADERCLVSGDLNGHVGQNNHVISSIHEEITHEIEEFDEWWNRTMEIKLRVAREILGESNGMIFENKETWWFSEEAEDATKQKREAKKRLEGTQMEEGWMVYKEANKLAKKTVAIANGSAYDQFYQELDTKEGQGKNFKLAQKRNKSTKDITHIRQIKDKDGNRRWAVNCGPVTEMIKAEFGVVPGKMKNSEAVGPDGIPAEAWTALDEERMNIVAVNEKDYGK
ncbi:uncharacterized protein LOC135222538 [Macrobrachium nipponense]|uniref:uncharacterized protein LOC135222538 n=1 Tax=Macrobrachium nipponense TaxID=159736 RepID=UPI0030C850C4